MINSTDLLAFINQKLLAGKGTEVTEQSLLFKDRHLDSITILSLIGYLEKKLKRKLKDEEISIHNFESVRSIVSSFTPHGLKN